MDLNINERLNFFFEKLITDSNFVIEDDTVLQKLQTSIQKYIKQKPYAFTWSQYVGLVAFISEALQEEYIKNEKNRIYVTLALHCLSCIIMKEEDFHLLCQQQIMNCFKDKIIILQKNATFSSASLKVTEALLDHKSGMEWIHKNDLWKKLLLPSLRSENIFVQRSTAEVISTLLLKINHDQILLNYLCDLEQVLIEQHSERMDPSLVSPKLEFMVNAVILILHMVIIQSLGNKSLSFQLKNIINQILTLLINPDSHLSSSLVTKSIKVLLMDALYKLQKKEEDVNSKEQYHIQSPILEILNFTPLISSKDYHKEFLVASFELHKWWNIMSQNIQEEGEESFSFFLLKLQAIPLQVLCTTLHHGQNTESRKAFQEANNLWNLAVNEKISLSNGQMIEMMQFADLLRQKLMKDSECSTGYCTLHLAHFVSIIKYLHLTSAPALFQLLVLILKYKADIQLLSESNLQFYLNMIDLLRSMVERFECSESGSVLAPLCHIIQISGMTAQIKVSVLQTISACLSNLFNLKSAAEATQSHFHTSITQEIKIELRNVISHCLSDVDWEVRDSALELILNWIQREKCLPSLDLFLKSTVLDHIQQAIGDAEPYVQATAISILASLVPVPEVWSKFEGNIKHLALRAVVRSGENCIKKSGLLLLQSLITEKKLKVQEVTSYVIPVVQAMTNDPDPELRFAALALIHQLLESTLSHNAMNNEKIAELILEDHHNIAQAKVFSVIDRFCQDGTMKVVFNCCNDETKQVKRKANAILGFIAIFMDNYNYKEQLSSTSLSVDAKAKGEAKPQTSTKTERITCENSDFEYVLQTSDLSVISKMTRQKDSCKSDWWEAEFSENLLNDNEVPLNFTAISAEDFLIEIEAAQNTGFLSSEEIEEDTEPQILLLLEDLFLVIESSQVTKESQAMDCY